MRSRLGPLLRSAAASAAAVRNPGIRRATVAFLAFNAVEMGAWTAILVYAYAATGPASVGVVAVAQLLPSAVAAPLLAGIGDRFPRALVLLGWFVVQGVAMLAVALGIRFSAAPIVAIASRSDGASGGGRDQRWARRVARRGACPGGHRRAA